MFLALRSPKVDTAFQMWSHKWQRGEKSLLNLLAMCLPVLPCIQSMHKLAACPLCSLCCPPGLSGPLSQSSLWLASAIVYCCVELFHPSYRTMHLSLLNFVLSGYLPTLSGSLSGAALPSNVSNFELWTWLPGSCNFSATHVGLVWLHRYFEMHESHATVEERKCVLCPCPLRQTFRHGRQSD